jgi:hypothetical protein
MCDGKGFCVFAPFAIGSVFVDGVKFVVVRGGLFEKEFSGGLVIEYLA